MPPVVLACMTNLSHCIPALRTQCRQKTIETKAKCKKCTLWWCPRCLLNRYGEAVDKVICCMCINCRLIEIRPKLCFVSHKDSILAQFKSLSLQAEQFLESPIFECGLDLPLTRHCGLHWAAGV